MADTGVSSKTFGLAIAFLTPGFIVVWPLSSYLPTLGLWLGSSPQQVTIGGFFYATVASLAAGLVVSAIRSTVLDFIHHKTGIRRPTLNYAKLQDNKEAFDIVIEGFYRYYQFYGNDWVGFKTLGLGRMRPSPFQARR